MMSTAVPAIEYRLSREHASHTCPLCGAAFETRPGVIPYASGSDEPVCGPDCPGGAELEEVHPCNARFQFESLSPETLNALRRAPEQLDLAERLRRAGLDDSLPELDRGMLQLAAIDLQFCEADTSRVVAWEPQLVIETCGEAAAELLLSGCGRVLG